MITVYTRKSNPSCRRAITWLQENKIEYEEIVVSDESLLTEKEVMRILDLSTGIYEIVSTRTKAYKRLDRDMEEMRVKSELVPFLIKNYKLLKYPIIVHRNKIQIGFNKDRLRVFVPKIRRKEQIRKMLLELQVI